MAVTLGKIWTRPRITSVWEAINLLSSHLTSKVKASSHTFLDWPRHKEVAQIFINLMHAKALLEIRLFWRKSIRIKQVSYHTPSIKPCQNRPFFKRTNTLHSDTINHPSLKTQLGQSLSRSQEEMVTLEQQREVKTRLGPTLSTWIPDQT